MKKYKFIILGAILGVTMSFIFKTEAPRDAIYTRATMTYLGDDRWHLDSLEKGVTP